jgi:hypothetical protein
MVAPQQRCHDGALVAEGQPQPVVLGGQKLGLAFFVDRAFGLLAGQPGALVTCDDLCGDVLQHVRSPFFQAGALSSLSHRRL